MDKKDERSVSDFRRRMEERERKIRTRYQVSRIVGVCLFLAVLSVCVFFPSARPAVFLLWILPVLYVFKFRVPARKAYNALLDMQDRIRRDGLSYRYLDACAYDIRRLRSLPDPEQLDKLREELPAVFDFRSYPDVRELKEQVDKWYPKIMPHMRNFRQSERSRLLRTNIARGIGILLTPGSVVSPINFDFSHSSHYREVLEVWNKLQLEKITVDFVCRVGDAVKKQIPKDDDLLLNVGLLVCKYAWKKHADNDFFAHLLKMIGMEPLDEIDAPLNVTGLFLSEIGKKWPELPAVAGLKGCLDEWEKECRI